MSIVQTYTAFANTKEYLENNASSTLEDMMKHCVQPALENIFGSLQYMTSSDTYPCILLPGPDGVIPSDYAPCICVTAAQTITNLDSAQKIQFGILDLDNKILKSLDQGYSYYSINSSKGNQAVSQNFTGQGIMFNARDLTGNGYQFGIYTSSGDAVTLGSMACKVLKGKDVVTDAETTICFVDLYGTSNTAALVYFKPSTGSVISEKLPYWNLPIQSSCVNMYEFNDGNVMIEDFYLCFPNSQQILKPLIVLDTAITPKDMWSANITINKVDFSLAIPPGVGSTGNSNMTIARKV